MNKFPPNSIIVIDILGDILKIKVSNDLIVNMENIGFFLVDDYMEFHVSGENLKIKKIKELIKHDALFLYGNGWYPSEIIEYYRDKGIEISKYKMISWKDPDTYYIEER